MPINIHLRCHLDSWLIGLYVERSYDTILDIWIGIGPIWCVIEYRSKEFR